MTDAEGVQFLQWCLPRLRLIWPGYRKVRRRVYKRIHRRVESLSLRSLADYRAYLETHPDEWMILDSYCWIPISRFYRDRSVFQCLEQEVLPALAHQAQARGEQVLRAWSLGCAGGEEPYSLSLLWTIKLQAQFPSVRLTVLASDVDEHAVTRAQRGCYPPGSLKDLPEDWRAEAFDQTPEGFYLKPAYRQSVTFLVQDIRKAAPNELFDLILCRYLAFTYFDAPLQRATLRRLTERMHRGGAFIVGRNEGLPDGQFGLIPWSEKEGVYRRAESTLEP